MTISSPTSCAARRSPRTRRRAWWPRSSATSASRWRTSSGAATRELQASGADQRPDLRRDHRRACCPAIRAPPPLSVRQLRRLVYGYQRERDTPCAGSSATWGRRTPPRSCSRGSAAWSTAATTPRASRSARAAGLKVRKAKAGSPTSPPTSRRASRAAPGIGHTRWATHGEPTVANAHPHIDTAQRIAVVHNGIIENADELRAKLAGRRRGVRVADRHRDRRPPGRDGVHGRRRRPGAGRPAGAALGRRRLRASRSWTPSTPTASSSPATAARCCWASARRRCSSPPTSPR